MWDKFVRWLASWREAPLDNYLAASTDLSDLERRLRELERNRRLYLRY